MKARRNWGKPIYNQKRAALFLSCLIFKILGPERREMKTLSLIIPLYNEEARIGKALKTLKKGFKFNGIKLEKVIFVDDGSKDETTLKIHQAKLEQYLKVPVEIISYSVNRGRGCAIKTGVLRSSSDYTLYCDADFSIPLKNLKKFIPYLEKDYDLLIGSKKKPGARAKIERSFLRNIIGFGHTVIASLILGVFVWDFQGGFKIFSKKLVEEIFPLLTIDRWGFDMEIIFLAKKLGYKTIELPVVWSHIENGSKVKLARDILRALKEMVKIKINWFKGAYLPSPIPFPKPFYAPV